MPRALGASRVVPPLPVDRLVAGVLQVLEPELPQEPVQVPRDGVPKEVHRLAVGVPRVVLKPEVGVLREVLSLEVGEHRALDLLLVVLRLVAGVLKEEPRPVAGEPRLAVLKEVGARQVLPARDKVPKPTGAREPKVGLNLGVPAALKVVLSHGELKVALREVPSLGEPRVVLRLAAPRTTGAREPREEHNLGELKEEPRLVVPSLGTLPRVAARELKEVLREAGASPAQPPLEPRVKAAGDRPVPPLELRARAAGDRLDRPLLALVPKEVGVRLVTPPPGLELRLGTLRADLLLTGASPPEA